MIAGIPGVGISGVFYLACACLMPFFEIVQTIRGRSSIKRWRSVLEQFALLSGIVGASIAVGFFMEYIIRKWIEVFSVTRQAGLVDVVRIQPIVLSLIVMVTLFTCIHMWHRFHNRKEL